jgi:hypothetical protein
MAEKFRGITVEVMGLPKPPDSAQTNERLDEIIDNRAAIDKSKTTELL